MKRQIYRKGLTFIDEEDYNEYVINEVELIVLNTEEYYNALKDCKNRLPKIRFLVNKVAIESGLILKSKNTKKIANFLLDDEMIFDYLGIKTDEEEESEEE